MASRLSAAMARSALYSWLKPRMAFRMTITRIMMASTVSPTTKEITAATISTMTITSVNCSRNATMGLRPRRSSSWFGPCSSSRRAASSRLSPSRREPRRSRTRLVSIAYQSAIRTSNPLRSHSERIIDDGRSLDHHPLRAQSSHPTRTIQYAVPRPASRSSAGGSREASGSVRRRRRPSIAFHLSVALCMLLSMVDTGPVAWHNRGRKIDRR